MFRVSEASYFGISFTKKKTQWIITRSEEDYYAMPHWLRPTEAQITTAHPLWVDIIPWYGPVLLSYALLKMY
jgi:hypothetical protein